MEQETFRLSLKHVENSKQDVVKIEEQLLNTKHLPVDWLAIIKLRHCPWPEERINVAIYWNRVITLEIHLTLWLDMCGMGMDDK